MVISKLIDEAVEVIQNAEKKKALVTKKLAPLKKESFSFLCENKLVFPVEKWCPNGCVGGVDSGFVAKRLAYIDLVLIRAVGVVFEYKDGKIKDAKYWPNYFDFPVPHLGNSALEEDEAQQSKSLMRLKEEVNATKKIIELHKPKYCFIDGSIIPQYQDKPRKESALSDNYVNIIHEFESLYETAEKNNCTLIATVEDSRGSRFVSIVQDEILLKNKLIDSKEMDGFYDSGFLDYFLGVGERSCAFKYTKNIKQHPVLSDFSEKWSENIYSFYIKPSLYDKPLRVEFIGNKDLNGIASEIASVVYALASLHREYAYPSILIEADFHAKLRPDEIDIVYNKIMDKLGASVKLKMRRDNRPF